MVIMASELSDDEKMVMTPELSGNDSHAVSFHRKRTAEGDSEGNPPTSPTKRHKKIVDKQEVHDFVPQGESLAEEDGDLGSNAAESEPSKGRDGRVNADGTTGNQEEIHAAKIAEEFRVLKCILRNLLERLEGRNKEDLEKALLRAEALELMCASGGSYQLAQLLSDAVQNRSRQAAIANFRLRRKSWGGKIERDCDALSSSSSSQERDSDAPSSSWDDDRLSLYGLDAPASVSQRQKNDPDLREKIHKVENDYWENRISRKVYNEERFKLYTEEEAKEARIVWPHEKHAKCYSPAGFRDAVFDQYDRTEDGPDWQTRMDFHYPSALSPTDEGEENLCELCSPLIEEDRDLLKARRRAEEEEEAKQEAARAKEWEETGREKWLLEMEQRERKRLEKALAKKNGPPCPDCNKTFATEFGLKAHAAAKHQK